MNAALHTRKCVPALERTTERRTRRQGQHAGQGKRATGVPMLRPTLIAGLLGTAAGIALPPAAMAQSCSLNGSQYSCSASGSFGSSIQMSQGPSQGSSSAFMPVTVSGSISYTAPSTTSAAIQVSAYGQDFNSGSPGGNAQGIQLNNSATIYQSAGPSPIYDYVFGIWGQQMAGYGDGGGSTTQMYTINNTGNITIALPGVQTVGGSGIWLADQGGGGNANTSGGSSAGAVITNSGAISATLSGQAGFAGLQAMSYGGNANNSGQGNGGNGGTAAVSSSGSVAVDWTWANAGSSNNGMWGVLALSQGGAGSNNDNGSGGAGGTSGLAGVQLAAGANVNLSVSGSGPSNASSQPSAGVLAASVGGSGGYGRNDNNASGNNGGDVVGGNYPIGNAGAPVYSAAISITDASVIVNGGLPAVVALAQGGAGGVGGVNENDGSNDPSENGGNGGNVRSAAAISIAAQNTPISITTSGGSNAAAVAALMQGGAGAIGGWSHDKGASTSHGGVGGSGGSILAPLYVTLAGSSATNSITLSTTGPTSPGVYAASMGGAAGNGNGADTALVGKAEGGNGGVGGNGGDVNVSLAYTNISTQGNNSPGIVAQSEGGIGGNGGSANAAQADGGSGEDGGNSGNVTVTTTGGTITTQAADSMGILAQSVSATGGNGGYENGHLTSGTDYAGLGGITGTVTVTNGSAITTNGDYARGILAQSLAGSGGTGGSSWASFHSGGGSGAPGGAANSVTVTHNGSIVTAGSNAHGILLQSVGGDGGAGGSASGVISNVGGGGGNGSGGGVVTYNSNNSSIVTSGTSAIGVLGQSIGGGGGDGGGASGVAVSIGGSGAAAANGNTVTANVNSSTITTTGDGATGMVMQSIGGGGGNGGNASAAAPFAAVTLGGKGKGGGAGGQVEVTLNNTTISTAGTKAPGLIAQSVGGGGGTGGNAASYSIGAGVSASVGLGGSAGNGNNGGLATATMTGGSILTGQDPRLLNTMPATPGGCSASNPGAMPCNALPVDSYGVAVQSIGGGGGLGGSAVAEAIAVSTPINAGGDQVALAAAVTMGGSGGTGGYGGTAQFSLSNGGYIETRGNGSTAVLVQSIGGGGGAGGDSSSTAAVIGYPNTLPSKGKGPGGTMEFTMGGSGADAGNGGTVNVAIGGTVSDTGAFTPDSNAARTAIVTYGDFAAGIKAQSVGGGGGDAGIGSGNTQGFGTGSSTSFAINAGSTGGGGGNGGTVTVNVYSGNGITTYGSGAMGVIAQSVGGGGGISQGGSYGVAQSFQAPNDDPDSKPSEKFKLGATINLGTTGGSGGSAQPVTVSIAAPITTYGSDATGVLVQSVGGGGGVGGGATGDGSGDSPIVQALNAREFQSDINAYLDNGQLPQMDPTFTLSFGGTGGSGGAGSTATATLNSTISTAGDWANGIVVQSIGGGGGKGGTGAASGTGSIAEVGINLDYALGGQGGSGGDGNTASLSLQNAASVYTQGFGASAIVVQSVGGGGGMGADGSDHAAGVISVGMAGAGNGGVAGNGGDVSFDFNGGNPVISTAGYLADGIVLQSVGGGGGIAGAGSSAFVQMSGPLASAQGTLKLTAGGGSATSGTGGDVTFSQNNTPLTIQTAGANSFGILAQSVGGGGGVINAAQTVQSPTVKIGGWGGGDGGNVSVTTTSSTSITSMGTASIGLFAQSVGNGGGVIRVAGASTTLPVLVTGANSSFAEQPHPGSGNGGNVNVANWGSINVTGAGSIGLFAQSVGGAGGLIMNGNTIYAGTPLQNESCGKSCGAGGNVTVSTNGPITASGPNGIGMFVQSIGYSGANGGNPDVQISAPVSGGTGSGAAGLVVDNTSNAAWVNVYSGGSLSADSNNINAVAVRETNSGLIALANYGGTITGSLYLNYGEFNNQSGTYNAGPVIQASIDNWADMVMLDPGMTSQLTGTFIQTGSGRLTTTIDSLNKRASLLRVNGYASVDGTIVPSAITLLPGELPVLTADNLDTTATAQDSLLYDWEARRSGNTISLNPNADFKPAGVPLGDSQASLANYYSRGWNNADPALAPLFAALSRINDGGEYKSSLNALSSKATQAQSMALANEAGAILGSSMSCPVFVGDSVQLGEDSCFWGQFSGRWSDQSGTGETQGYHVSGTTYRLGGQRQIAPGWYLGGSVAAGQTWARMDGGSTGDGDTYDGSLTLKRVDGPWHFAGSVAMATGSFNNNRRVQLPGVDTTLSSSPNMFLVGARFRAAYEASFDGWYMKPYNDIDVVHTHMPGFKESGAAPYALNVRGSDQTNVMVTPMLEFGIRRQIDAKTTLRAYAGFGASWRPDGDRSIHSSVVGASSADGTFTDYIKAPELLGKVDLGLQFYRYNGFEIKASYTADIGSSFLSQTASARFAYHF
ncbi:autotransporter outer membrane beta-barrel domain-containing protein [Bordetella flabilis]|uniref:Autotransporter domain-containing protein n=2 Tax=Bordetella flabilis TaxID=463014 RepID=A0A193GD87_9BORD|nr:autotransporter outer membrane beta-barrel domain-containing protein [Bordetella flabilis]ANN77780.1 hypothetical protein BAU07_12300 [Bordetella flabilis]